MPVTSARTVSGLRSVSKAFGVQRPSRHSTAPVRQRHRTMATSAKPVSGLELLTASTPNGWKASVTLEELGLPYHLTPISLKNNEQKSPEFLKINPNGRIPALVDHAAGDLAIFESGEDWGSGFKTQDTMGFGSLLTACTGAIMLYLCENYDPEGKLLPKDKQLRYQTISWLMWQMGGLGPMQGQANHFTRYAPERVEYGINRYTNETKRLLGVLNSALEGREYLVGDSLTLADIASYCWANMAPYAIDNYHYEDLDNLKAWLDQVGARPAVQRGMEVPEKSKVQEALKDPELMKKMVADAQSMMVSTKKE